MMIGILGAGAIGCAVGGRLARGGARVVLVGRPWVAERVRSGLVLSRWGEEPVPFPASVEVSADVGALSGCEVVLVATKSKDTRAAARQLLPVLREGAVVGSLQNGVRNPGVLAEELPGRTIWPAMVPFNVLWTERGLHQGTSGPVVLPEGAERLVEWLRAGGADAVVCRDVPAVQWGKLLLNLNNAVNALSGMPIQEMLSDIGYRRILAGVIGEGLSVLRAAQIRVRGVGRIQPALAPFVLRLPDWLFFRAASAMIRIDPLARASMAEDLARGRLTEVDELNGEIVSVAASIGQQAPRNQALVRLVHEAEAQGPRPWSAAELEKALGRGSG
jgi:2-dehydropantoate 2-reductase